MLFICGRKEVTEMWAMGKIVLIMPCWACSTGCSPSDIRSNLYIFTKMVILPNYFDADLQPTEQAQADTG